MFEGEKQVWYVIPVSRLKNILYSPVGLLPSSKICTGSKNLKVQELDVISLQKMELPNQKTDAVMLSQDKACAKVM
jgi:hypothetical protein